MTNATCSKGDCPKSAHAKGLCKKHYADARGDRLSQEQCKADGCTNPQGQTGGYCPACYQRDRLYGDPNAGPPRRKRQGPRPACSIDGCAKWAEKRGWCGAHYLRWRKYGDPLGKAPVPVHPVCSVEGCTDLTKTMTSGDSGRYCRAHYKRLMRYGDPEGLPVGRYPKDATERPCTKCGVTKPLDEFSYQREGQFGRHSECRVCLSARQRKHAQSLPEDARLRVRRNGVRCKYGDDGVMVFDRIRQGEACEVCASYTERMHIDHDHDTGKVRGLLCSNCNSAMGLLSDDPVRLRLLADYLERAAGPVSSERTDGTARGDSQPVGQPVRPRPVAA